MKKKKKSKNCKQIYNENTEINIHIHKNIKTSRKKKLATLTLEYLETQWAVIREKQIFVADDYYDRIKRS